MDKICCITGYSFLDVWTLAHLGFWLVAGSTVRAFLPKFKIGMSACMIVAYGWEVFEHFMAPRFPNIWEDPESWWNSWISDPLMCLVGVALIWWLLDHRKRKKELQENHNG